jgi:HK97 family phage portal protein
MQLAGYEIGLFYVRKAQQPAQQRAWSLTNPDTAHFFGSPSMNPKITVTDSTVLEIPPAWAAIRYISEGIANLGRGVFVRKSGDVLPDYDSPVAQLFNGRPHPHYTTFDFLQTLVANACLGNGYARIYRDRATMAPTALEIIPSSYVDIVYGNEGQLFYHVCGTINDRSVNVYLPETDMIHIKGVTFTGEIGKRVSLVHRDTFSVDVAANEYTNKYFEKGATVGGILSFPNPLTPEQRTALKGKALENHQGSANAGSIMVLDAGADFKPMQNSPKDAAVMDFKNLSTVGVSQIFKVPLHLLSDLTKSTFSNIEQQNQDFVVHCLEPWAGKIEEEFTSKLFTTSEIKNRKRFFAFDFSQYKMGDMKAQAEFFGSMVQNGIMTRNEVRAKFNLNKMEGGDDLTVQINLAPIEMLPSIMTPTSNGQTQQPTETESESETDDAEEPTTATDSTDSTDSENES